MINSEELIQEKMDPIDAEHLRITIKVKDIKF